MRLILRSPRTQVDEATAKVGEGCVGVGRGNWLTCAVLGKLRTPTTTHPHRYTTSFPKHPNKEVHPLTLLANFRGRHHVCENSGREGEWEL